MKTFMVAFINYDEDPDRIILQKIESESRERSLLAVLKAEGFSMYEIENPTYDQIKDFACECCCCIESTEI